MTILVLVRAGSDPADLTSARAIAIASQCEALLIRARRDNVAVIHYFSAWPPGEPQLGGCAPRRLEMIVSSASDLQRAASECGPAKGAQSAPKLLIAGFCEQALYKHLVRLARSDSLEFDIATAAFKLITARIVSAHDAP